MRILVVCLAVAAVGLGVWMLLPDGTDGDNTDYVTDSTPEEGGARLHGMKADGGPAPDAVENPGRSTIVGTVRLAGTPQAADVELRVVAQSNGDSMESLLNTMGKAFVDRLLDGGVARGGALDTDAAGDDGRFKFRGVGPGVYELRARDADGRRSVASVSIPADGARVEVDIDLPSGDVTLRGLVKYDDDTPFRGTIVVSPGVSEMSPFMPPRGPQGQTDADGRFTIGGLAAGTVVVNAISPGSIRAMALPITLPYEGEYVLVVGAGGTPVKGKVIAADTKEPLVGARVLAGGGNPAAGFLVRTTTTDAEGMFEMKVPGMQGGMIAMAPGYGMAMVELRGDRPTDLVVPLPKLARVKGVLTAKDGGEPLAGVPVYAMPQGGMGGPFAMPSTTRTGTDGSYTLDGVNPGTAILFAYGGGYATPGIGANSGSRRGSVNGITIALRPGEEKEQDLVAVRAGRVEGTVRTDAGRPVPGAVVALERSGDFMLRYAALFGLTTGMMSTVTDADGRYVLDTVVPGVDSTVAVQAVGYAKSNSPSFTGESGKVVTQDVVLEEARWLEVTVVDDETGKPVSNAMVRLRAKDKSESFISMGEASPFVTDARGKARVGPLSKGEVEVRAHAQGYLEEHDWTSVEDGATEATVRLPRGLEISGRVVLPEGMPHTQVEVRVRSQGRGRWFRRETAPKPDGTWIARGIEEGTYRVSVRARFMGARYEGEVQDVEAGATDVVVELAEVERGAELVVKVVDVNGDPVSAGRIQLRMRHKNGTSSSSRRLSGGRAVFELDDERDPDELTVQVYRIEGGEGGALFSGPIDANKGEVVLTLPPGRSLRGRVTASGKGVAGVQIEASGIEPGDDDDSHGSDVHASTVTDSEGRYELVGLGPYAYSLSVQPPSTYERPPNVKVGARQSSADVELREGLRAKITVVDPKGKPVVGSWVNVNASGDRRESGFNGANSRTDGQGVAILEGLPVGVPLRMSVQVPDDRDDIKPYSVDKWHPADTRVELEPAVVIAGIVRDKSGAIMKEGRVRARVVGTTEREQNASVDKKGRFKLKNLDAGEYELWYEGEGHMSTFGPGMQSAEPKRTRVTAPATDLSLVADLGLTIRIKITSWREPDGWHQASLRPANGHGWANTEVADDGTCLFHGLQEGATYTFSIMNLPNDRYVLKTGLRPGDTATVQMQKGRTIRGRVLGADAMKKVRVNVQLQGDGWSLGGEVSDDFRYEIRGVPEGTWRVRAFGNSEEGQLQGEANVAAGGEADITLERRR